MDTLEFYFTFNADYESQFTELGITISDIDVEILHDKTKWKEVSE